MLILEMKFSDFFFELLSHLYFLRKRRCHEYQDKVSVFAVFASCLSSSQIFRRDRERKLIGSQVRIRIGMCHYVRRQGEINTIFSQIQPLNLAWGSDTKCVLFEHVHLEINFFCHRPEID